ncbi:hypothetical protein [Providencia rettgeri]|nr:hypothetical protein [Providencia rettgeri]MBV2188438.1 hypothetical protein [Providencia rettgeri]
MKNKAKLTNKKQTAIAKNKKQKTKNKKQKTKNKKVYLNFIARLKTFL